MVPAMHSTWGTGRAQSLPVFLSAVRGCVCAQRRPGRWSGWRGLSPKPAGAHLHCVLGEYLVISDARSVLFGLG